MGTTLAGKEHTQPQQGFKCKHLPLMIGTRSRTGTDPFRRPRVNEDTFAIFEYFGGQRDQILVLILDGHGRHGKLVSQFVQILFISPSQRAGDDIEECATSGKLHLQFGALSTA